MFEQCKINNDYNVDIYLELDNTFSTKQMIILLSSASGSSTISNV